MKEGKPYYSKIFKGNKKNNVYCKRCGSTKSRTWLFGKRKCDNEKCSGTREDKLNYLTQ
jgi:hypothetical protein